MRIVDPRSIFDTELSEDEVAIWTVDITGVDYYWLYLSAEEDRKLQELLEERSRIRDEAGNDWEETHASQYANNIQEINALVESAVGNRPFDPDHMSMWVH